MENPAILAGNTAAMRSEFQCKANGKFMLTGEYMVLRGAETLALPLKLGQQLLIVPNEGEAIYWESFEPAGKWFETALHNQSLAVLAGTDESKSNRLREILQHIRKQNPGFLADGGYWVRTDLDFNPQFGMGSSSTLLAALCEAAGVNPYPVLRETFGGSGYDLACAFASGPLVFAIQNDSPLVRPVALSAQVTQHILFVYSGNKMVSAGEVRKFSGIQIADSEVQRFTEITREAILCQNHKDFEKLMREHEDRLALILERPVLQQIFPDFKGTLKSMGAWGGDFFMAVCEDTDEAKSYFENKGFPTVFRYDEIVLA